MSNVDHNKKKTGLYIVLGIVAIAAVIAAFFIGKVSSYQTDESEPIETTIYEDNDSTDAVDSIAVTNNVVKEKEDKKNKSTKDSDTKPSVAEQIKEQNKQTSDATDNGDNLTPIPRDSQVKQDKDDDGELTRIEPQEE